jgi:hypothetical protein
MSQSDVDEADRAALNSLVKRHLRLYLVLEQRHDQSGARVARFLARGLTLSVLAYAVGLLAIRGWDGVTWLTEIVLYAALAAAYFFYRLSEGFVRVGPARDPSGVDQ